RDDVCAGPHPCGPRGRGPRRPPARVLRQHRVQRRGDGGRLPTRSGGHGGRVQRPRLHRPGHRVRRLLQAQHRQQGHGRQDEGDLRGGAREEPETAMNATTLRSPRIRHAVWVVLSLALLLAGCEQKWYAAKDPDLDAEVDKAFFAGLDFKAIPNVPEPKSLRPCCVLGNDIGAEVESIAVPGYEIRYTLDVDSLGTHQFNKGFITFEARGGKRLLSDEVSGILYTCRGGFLDIAHVRDNAYPTGFFASQIEQLAATRG